MNDEIERTRGALRGRRLPTLAAELGVPLPTLEHSSAAAPVSRRSC